VFTGHPDERMRAVAQLASTLGISERCVFLGFVEEETLSAVMDAAGAMLFPSLYEGFGIPVYEALAASIPMAVSLIPVLRETAGDAPLWCRPGNIADWTQAILTLSGNEPERIRRIAAARARYELLKTGSCYDTLWNAFLRLVSTTPPKPAATVSCGAKTETPETFVGVLEAFIAATARSEAIPLSSINSMREIVAAEWRRIR
jgi:glycosyltransferase involved in cell wall biosynthesis